MEDELRVVVEKGAVSHKVLQIRGMIASHEWGNRWQSAVLSALKVEA